MGLFIVELYAKELAELLESVFLIVEHVVFVQPFHMCEFVFDACHDYF